MSSKRLDAWLRQYLRVVLGALFALREAPLESPDRGLAFQLSEALGLLPRRGVASAHKALDKPARARLRALGVTFGIESLYLRRLGDAKAQQLKALLWSLWHRWETRPAMPGRNGLIRQPEPGNADFWGALGHVLLSSGERRLAVRADRLEALSRDARKLSASGPFVASPALCRTIRGDSEDAQIALAAIGYWAVEEEGAVTFHRRPKRGARRRAAIERNAAKKAPGKARRSRKALTDSPFAVLRTIKFGG